MQIHEQPHVPERDESSQHPLTGQHSVPAPVRSVAHVSEAVDEWNPIVPGNKTWTPRGRRATHRATGKH